MTAADDLATSVREALGYLDDAYTWEATKALDFLIERAEAAEAEAERLRDGLWRIADVHDSLDGADDSDFARALLADDRAAHRGSCRVHYEEGVCTCGAEDGAA